MCSKSSPLRHSRDVAVSPRSTCFIPPDPTGNPCCDSAVKRVIEGVRSFVVGPEASDGGWGELAGVTAHPRKRRSSRRGRSEVASCV